MAEFSKLVITEKGQNLIAQMLAGSQKIVFTAIVSSDTVYEQTELEQLEELSGIRQTGEVSKVLKTDNATVKVETVFTNTDLTEGYYMRTLGLYAQAPEGGQLLYAAAVETSGNCFMPAFGGVTVSGAYIQLVTTVSSAENVTVEVDNSAYATIGDIHDLQEQIDQLSGELAGTLAGIQSNASNIRRLDGIGKKLREFNAGGGVEIAGYGVGYTIKEIAGSEFSGEAWNDKRYYLYHLVGNISTTSLFDHTNEIYEGRIVVSLSLGAVYNSWGQDVIFSRINSGFYQTTPINIIGLYGPPSESMGIETRIQPFVSKRGENGEPINAEIPNLICRMTLTIYNMGSILEEIQGGTGGTVVSNYNLLTNKPSINSVTLQGNLTTEQLGLVPGGSGEGVTELTYEETMAELNAEEEAV